MTQDEDNGIVLTVQEARSIPEGTHTGRITGLDTRENPYPYLDLKVDILDMEGDSPAVLGSDSPGFPLKLTSESWLAALLEKFGAKIGDAGEEINVEEILVGRAIQFETKDEQTENGTFANIEKQSIRPHPDYSDEDVWGGEEDEEDQEDLEEFED